MDFAFASFVFIHLNLYQVCEYFEELQRVVRKKGRIWIGFANADSLIRREMMQEFLFMAHCYKKNPLTLPHLMHFNSPVAYLAIAKEYGFRLLDQEEDTAFLFEKVKAQHEEIEGFCPFAHHSLLPTKRCMTSLGSLRAFRKSKKLDEFGIELIVLKEAHKLIEKEAEILLVHFQRRDPVPNPSH